MANKNIIMNFSGGKDSFTTYLKLREDPTVNTIKLCNFDHHLLMYETETNEILQAALRSMYVNDLNFNEYAEEDYKLSSTLAYGSVDLSQHYFSTGEIDIMNELGDFWKAIPGKTKGWYNPYYNKDKTYFLDDYEKWEIGSLCIGVVTNKTAPNIEELLPLVGTILTASDLRKAMEKNKGKGTVYSQIQTVCILSNQIIGDTITPEKQALIDAVKAQHNNKPLVALY